MTLDGFCDHTAIIPDEEIHQHYTEQLSDADAILFGRITYELMQYWQTLVKNPSGEKTIFEILSISTANSSVGLLPVGFFTTDGQ